MNFNNGMFTFNFMGVLLVLLYDQRMWNNKVN